MTGLAQAITAGDVAAASQVSRSILPVRGDNLVERPWGGQALLRLKGITVPVERRHGESFEVSAWPHDEEARRYPSIVCLPDGSEMALPELLGRLGPRFLGERLFGLVGPGLPLLPKLVDVKELLSVQAHPPGNPELYLVLEAEAGATVRLGFREDMDGAALRERWLGGRRFQEELLGLVRADTDLHALQGALGPALAAAETADALTRRIGSWLRPGVERGRVASLTSALAELYWETLGWLNAIAVQPGQILFNASLSTSGAPCSAEVHALGNPEQKEILLLEIRRPAVTYRAWDHVRFPLRPLDVDRTLASLGLGARRPESFFVTPQPVAGRPGLYRSATCHAFIVEHLVPGAGEEVLEPGLGEVHTLHGLHGTVRLIGEGGETLATLRRGHSAVAGAGIGAYRAVRLGDEEAELVRVRVP